PDGYNGPTISNVGNDGLDSDGQVVKVTINNADDMTIDSGFVKEPATPVYNLGDKVWFDQDKDGVQDANEPGIAGVIVTLTKPDGSTVTTTTDANGNYIFTNLPNGDYTITFSTPEGYTGPTITNVGNDGLDSDGQVVKVTINNADDMTIDSGFVIETPNEPETPSEPGTPLEPGEPSEPGNHQVENGESSVPNNTVKSETPVTSYSTVTTKVSEQTPKNDKTLATLPDTGEENNGGALAAILAGIGGALLYRRKK
ncbi:SdrD B-like domain-containing protein, partial [Macrococcus capreoli]|uniref:SdrD B-like domain-containing protein n=1 Tax=Macrococcus capreoli TaxID=2982690 RepID=UPI0029500874